MNELPQQHAMWIAQARAHWEEHLPKMYARLVESKRLLPELTEAAEATAGALQTLVNQGFNRQEAWEQVREQYLFLPPEPAANESPAPSQGYAAMMDYNRTLGSLEP